MDPFLPEDRPACEYHDGDHMNFQPAVGRARNTGVPSWIQWHCYCIECLRVFTRRPEMELDEEAQAAVILEP